MTRSRIEIITVLVAVVACAGGFAARSVLGDPTANQLAGVARVVAFAGLGVLLANIGWHVYRAKKNASTPR